MVRFWTAPLLERTTRKEPLFFCCFEELKENGSFLNRRTPLLERKKKNRSKTRAACFKNRSSFLFFSFLFFSFLFFCLFQEPLKEKLLGCLLFLKNSKRRAACFKNPLFQELKENGSFLNSTSSWTNHKKRTALLFFCCFALLCFEEFKEKKGFLFLFCCSRKEDQVLFQEKEETQTNHVVFLLERCLLWAVLETSSPSFLLLERYPLLVVLSC